MRILVAGIGNIFLGDDGFGVEVVHRLQQEQFGDGVDVADFGIRGVHLAFELADGRYDAAILVDAVSRGGPAGTLYTIEADPGENEEPPDADAHTLDPDAVLRWVRRVGGRPARVFIVGCEPMSIEESMGLSGPVAASVDGAVRMVRDLVGGLVPCV
jgi:hydrogenase maturation protease